jgi:rhodanese-related sulfurtransferase
VVTATATAPVAATTPVTATAPVTASVFWESRLYSDPSSAPAAADGPGAGRGWDAPLYDGIDDQLRDARSRLLRVSARAAYQEVLFGRAVLVDIRPAAQRAAEGEVAAHLAPLVVERNVLEWRFDPRSAARRPEAAFDTRVIVLCQEGYTSSLAADALLRLGIRRATDVVGGFRAWREAGLPVAA